MKIYVKANITSEDSAIDKLSAINIDQYKPSNAIIQKIMDYRSRGSKVNVSAIKDLKKLLTYYYTAKLIGWGELANDCEYEYMRSKFPGKYFEKEDLINAINTRVQVDSQYADTRTDFEKKYDLPDSKGLFTFEERSCWVPKKVLMYFIENNIPVHFGRRTSGAGYDRNGRQWSEVEHLTMFPDSDSPINYTLVVHTDEGGGATTYTSTGAGERVSAKKVVDDIDRKIRRFRG